MRRRSGRVPLLRHPRLRDERPESCKIQSEGPCFTAKINGGLGSNFGGSWGELEELPRICFSLGNAVDRARVYNVYDEIDPQELAAIWSVE